MQHHDKLFYMNFNLRRSITRVFHQRKKKSINTCVNRYAIQVTYIQKKNGIPVTRPYTQILLRLHECFLIGFLCYFRILISVSATIFHHLPFPFFHNFAASVNIVFSNIPGDFSMPSIRTIVFYNITFPYSFILCVTLHSTELVIYKHTFTSNKDKSFVILIVHDIMKTLTSEYK